jgi:mono/diheme cytochrome c family protein
MIKQVLALAIIVLAGCAADDRSERSPLQAAEISDGRDIAEAQCAACHAVGPYGDSPNQAAPPLRRVLSRYDANALEQELIEGIQVVHPMPEFQFNPRGADALIAYLRSIQEPDEPESP